METSVESEISFICLKNEEKSIILIIFIKFDLKTKRQFDSNVQNYSHTSHAKSFQL